MKNLDVTSVLTDKLINKVYSVKEGNPQTLVLLRSGDVYYSFGEDALRIANLCKIPVINTGLAIQLFFNIASFQSDLLDVYLPRLVKTCNQVAIYDIN